MSISKPLTPEWVSPPADTINDLLEEAGWTHTEFAERLGYSMKHVHDLVHGKQPINADMAVRLESVVGGSAQFWLNRESQYQESIARQKAQRAWANEGAWLETLPVAEMMQRKWIPNATSIADKVRQCLRFFGVSSVTAWKDTYSLPVEQLAALRRGKVTPLPGAAAAWLRRGEIKAAAVDTEDWNPSALKAMVPRLRAFVKEHHPDDVVTELESVCAEAGVALAVVRAPTNCAISGATKFLSKDKAMILLSFRSCREDQAWFTFFHEIGHLLLHSKKLVFVDVEDHTEERNAQEREANEFAQDVLIPREHQEKLKYVDSRQGIETFAREVGVSRGIVAGQVQRRDNNYAKYNDLIRKCSGLERYN